MTPGVYVLLVTQMLFAPKFQVSRKGQYYKPGFTGSKIVHSTNLASQAQKLSTVQTWLHRLKNCPQYKLGFTGSKIVHSTNLASHAGSKIVHSTNLASQAQKLSTVQTSSKIVHHSTNLASQAQKLPTVQTWLHRLKNCTVQTWLHKLKNCPQYKQAQKLSTVQTWLHKLKNCPQYCPLQLTWKFRANTKNHLR